jgi:hypothetical protein
MSHIAMVKCVTYNHNGKGDKLEVLFPVRGGLSITTTEVERRDREYYTPVGIEIDVSGGLRKLDSNGLPTQEMEGGLVDPRTGEPFTGVTIHIPANGDKLTERKGAYRQWKSIMEIQNGWHFADVVFLENAQGKTVDAYRWPPKSRGGNQVENVNEAENVNETDNGNGMEGANV